MKGFSEIISDTFPSAKSIVKMILLSRPVSKRIRNIGEGKRILILGNGPALKQDLAEHLDEIKKSSAMEVNFAANAPEFFQVCPEYYVMVDPAFFSKPYSEMVEMLMSSFKKVHWEMLMFVPKDKVDQMRRDIDNRHIRIEGINPVGVEGWGFLEKYAYASGLGMPRPRNVLIVAIMVAILMGFKEIYLLGADHSWSRTLSVDEDNYVVSVQPHFYKDNPAALAASRELFKGIRIHEVMESYSIAFRGYHRIKRFADKKNIKIFNATVGSFIDAFPRKKPWKE